MVPVVKTGNSMRCEAHRRLIAPSLCIGLGRVGHHRLSIVEAQSITLAWSTILTIIGLRLFYYWKTCLCVTEYIAHHIVLIANSALV